MTLKIYSNAENLRTKEMGNAEKFSVIYLFFFFSVIPVSLNNKGKYFSVIILDYRCDFLCKHFSVWFLHLFSVTKIFSVISV